MSKLRWTIVAALAVGTVAVSTLAHAQGEPRGGGRGGRGAGARADSVRTLDEQDPVAMLLEHSGDLSLSSDQTNRIAVIKQRLNANQRPLIAELDSLRPPGPPPHFDPAMSPEARDSLMARRRAVSAVMAQVRTLQQTARTDSWAVLSDEQRAKADALELRLRNDARRPREDIAPDPRGGRGGRGGGGGVMGGMGGAGQPPR